MISKSQHYSSNGIMPNLKHNLDNEYRSKLENVISAMTEYNVVLENNYDLKKSFKENVLNILQKNNKLDELKNIINAYNNKQKRSDRKININTIFDKHKKQHITHKEVLLEFGNNNEHPKIDDCIYMLDESFKKWKKQHPNCYITAAVIHCDEPDAGPHLHISFFTYESNREAKRGLPVNFSFDNSLGLERNAFEKDKNIFYEEMDKLLIERGYEPKPIEHHQLEEHIQPKDLKKCKSYINKKEKELKKEYEKKYTSVFEKVLNALPKIVKDVYHKLWDIGKQKGYDVAHDPSFTQLLKDIESSKIEPKNDPKRENKNEPMLRK